MLGKKPDPLRAALAAANATTREAVQRHAAAKKALDDFLINLSETRSRWAQAERALEDAQVTERDLLRSYAGNKAAVHAYCGSTGHPDPFKAVVDATAERNEARRFLDVGNEGRAFLEGALIAAEDYLDRATRQAEAAALQVMATRLPEMLEEADRLWHDLARRFILIADLATAYPSSMSMSRPTNSPDFGHRIADFFARTGMLPRPSNVSSDQFTKLRAEVTAPWKATLAELLQNADAKLPT